MSMNRSSDAMPSSTLRVVCGRRSAAAAAAAVDLMRLIVLIVAEDDAFAATAASSVAKSLPYNDVLRYIPAEKLLIVLVLLKKGRRRRRCRRPLTTAALPLPARRPSPAAAAAAAAAERALLTTSSSVDTHAESVTSTILSTAQSLLNFKERDYYSVLSVKAIFKRRSIYIVPIGRDTFPFYSSHLWKASTMTYIALKSAKFPPFLSRIPPKKATFASHFDCDPTMVQAANSQRDATNFSTKENVERNVALSEETFFLASPLIRLKFCYNKAGFERKNTVVLTMTAATVAPPKLLQQLPPPPPTPDFFCRAASSSSSSSFFFFFALKKKEKPKVF